MDHGENKHLATSSFLCKASCGFYGSPSFNNYCSTCYQKHMKNMGTSASDPRTANGIASYSSANTLPLVSNEEQTPIPNITPTFSNQDETTESMNLPSLVKEDPTTPNRENYSSLEEASPSSLEASSPCVQPAPRPAVAEGSGSGGKRNRCAACRKKVGLTAVTCRCGGVFCAAHRYSDRHDCDFDYRALGAREIRAGNPLVRGERVAKF